jgi:SagB-type dehydrogenase family enzyme
MNLQPQTQMHHHHHRENKERSTHSKSQGIRLRRSRSLIAYWEDGEFVIENYIYGKQTTVSPILAHILQRLDGYQFRESILEALSKVPHASLLVDLLISQGVFVVEGSDLDKKEQMIDKIWKWKIDARYFHYSTKKTVFEKNLDAENRNLAELAKINPPPSPFKDYYGSSSRIGIKLAGLFNDNSLMTGNEESFWRTLYNRRTRRAFIRKKISFLDFSRIMLWTWGKTKTIEDPDVGEYILKTSPSGGARHPIEVYPLVLRVEGIAQGLYHYSVRYHGLQLIKAGKFEDLAVHLCAGQKWVRDSSVVFFMTAKLERSMWKYSQSHAYRVILLDAGHLGQTFHLVCTKLKLAPFTTAATNDSKIESIIGIDGVTEIPLYTAVVGIPNNKG